MNKKELAKLLFQHKDIKSLFESGQFDASTLKKVISEEIMRESEVDSPDLNAEISQLQNDLAFAQASLVKFEKEILLLKHPLQHLPPRMMNMSQWLRKKSLKT